MTLSDSALSGRRPLSRGKIVILALDFIVFNGIYNFSHFFRLGTWVDYFTVPYAGISLIVFLSLYVFDAYGGNTSRPQVQLPLRAVFAIIMAGFFSAGFVYLFGPQQFDSVFGRGVMPVTLAAFSVWIGLSRLIWIKIFSRQAPDRYWLFVGKLETFRRLHAEFGFPPKTVEIMTDDVKGNGHDSLDFDIVGREGSLESTANPYWKEIIYSSNRPLTESIVSAVMSFRQKGIKISDLNSFYEYYLAKVPVLQMDKVWFFHGSSFSLVKNQSGFRLKRILDYLLAVLIFAATFPLQVVVACLIKLSSTGPVLYRQRRVGLDGKIFEIVKFRTMVQDAEARGAQWATEQDPRITSFGKLLRVTRIDELPQLLNVIKGEMSFIGPRPERPEFVRDLEKEIPYYEIRH